MSFVVVRSGGVKDSGLKRIYCRGDQFVTNAVAVSVLVFDMVCLCWCVVDVINCCVMCVVGKG